MINYKYFRYIKIVGNRNTANRIFHLVSMEVRYLMKKYDLLNELIGKPFVFEISFKILLRILYF